MSRLEVLNQLKERIEAVEKLPKYNYCTEDGCYCAVGHYLKLKGFSDEKLVSFGHESYYKLINSGELEPSNELTQEELSNMQHLNDGRSIYADMEDDSKNKLNQIKDNKEKVLFYINYLIQQEGNNVVN